MRGLTDEEIVRAWELWSGAPHVERPLALLAATGGPIEELRSLPIGVRDARLLELHAQTFGPVLDMLLVCPACGEQLELAVEAMRLAEGPAALPATITVTVGQREVELRPLDTHDLSRAAALGDLTLASEYLLDAAIVAVRPEGPLTDDDRRDLAEHLAELDPRADLMLEAACPACAHVWPATLDVSSFVGAQITAAARRLFQQVATLARAFGWTEPQVLALGHARRRAYLELAETAIAGGR